MQKMYQSIERSKMGLPSLSLDLSIDQSNDHDINMTDLTIHQTTPKRKYKHSASFTKHHSRKDEMSSRKNGQTIEDEAYEEYYNKYYKLMTDAQKDNWNEFDCKKFLIWIDQTSQTTKFLEYTVCYIYIYIIFPLFLFQLKN